MRFLPFIIVAALVISGCVASQTGTGQGDTVGQSTATKLTACGDVTSDSVLDADLVTTSRCFNIKKSGVTLDCQGHSITTSGLADYPAIYAEKVENVKISDCVINGFGFGVSFDSVNSSEIRGNTVTGARNRGVRLYNSVGITVDNNKISGAKFDGIYLYYSDNAVVANNDASRNAGGFYSEGSQGATVSNNRFCGNIDYDAKCDPAVSGTGNTLDTPYCGKLEASKDC